MQTSHQQSGIGIFTASRKCLWILASLLLLNTKHAIGGVVQRSDGSSAFSVDNGANMDMQIEARGDLNAGTPETSANTIPLEPRAHLLASRLETPAFDFAKAAEMLATSGILSTLDNSKASQALRQASEPDGVQRRSSHARSAIDKRGITDMLVKQIHTQIKRADGSEWGVYNNTMDFNIFDTNTNTSTTCYFSYTTQQNSTSSNSSSTVPSTSTPSSPPSSTTTSSSASSPPVKLNTWHICGSAEDFQSNMEFFAWSFVDFTSPRAFSLKFLHLFQTFVTRTEMSTIEYLTAPITVLLDTCHRSRVGSGDSIDASSDSNDDANGSTTSPAQVVVEICGRPNDDVEIRAIVDRVY